MTGRTGNSPFFKSFKTVRFQKEGRKIVLLSFMIIESLQSVLSMLSLKRNRQEENLYDCSGNERT